MKAEIKRKNVKGKRKKSYGQKAVGLAMDFAARVNKELAGMVSAVVLFGSAARPAGRKAGDVDILVILDDVRIGMTPALVQTYRIIIQKLIADVDKDKLHVQILNLTAWWGYVRSGDPVAVNILRDGFALVDTGWFDPLQALLDAGKIRPSEEAVWTYMNMSEASLYRAEGHLISGAMDLYWAVIDAAHAALMSKGIVPQAPKYMADSLREYFVKSGEIGEKLAKTMEMFYKTSKDIIHKRITVVAPKDLKKYRELAVEFVKAMRRIVKKNSSAVVRGGGEIFPELK